MQDITIQKKPFLWKEHAVNFLIAIIPASILIVLLKEFLSITGAFLPLVLIFGGEIIVGKIRKKKDKESTWKTIAFWIFMNILILGFLPILLLTIF